MCKIIHKGSRLQAIILKAGAQKTNSETNMAHVHVYLIWAVVPLNAWLFLYRNSHGAPSQDPAPAQAANPCLLVLRGFCLRESTKTEAVVPWGQMGADYIIFCTFLCLKDFIIFKRKPGLSAWSLSVTIPM